MQVEINKYGIKGLISSKKYSKNDVIAELKGKVNETPSRYSIQLSPNQHIEVNNDVKYVNHNCQPTARIKGNKLIANKDILPGDEITFDYNTTEDKLAEPFVCMCCGRLIRGKAKDF